MGESNAESALREERINDDFKQMKEKRRKKRDKQKKHGKTLHTTIDGTYYAYKHERNNHK